MSKQYVWKASLPCRRRSISVAATGLAVWILTLPATALSAPMGGREALPPPVVDPHSTEICMNSRLSYHGGWNAGGTEQMLADVLHAAARAPVTGESRTIYAATSENVYVYDEASHELVVHRPGDWRADGSSAFEVGIAAQRTLDAGGAMHLAQLESVALWTGAVGQLASCARASATTYANSNWDLPDPVDIVISFGIRNVPGLTDALVAISSDGSLPNPETDGAVYLDSALVALSYGEIFAPRNLDLSEISQVLWGAYGCTDHYAAGSKGGLVCASAVAYYYLTQHIYAVNEAAVYRFHNRLPPGNDLTTRDHRIVAVTPGDVRVALRAAVADLPEAPFYLVICLGQTGSWQELEVGFAAMGALLQASSMGLQAHIAGGLSADEQTAIQAAAGLPSGDLPIAVMSLGPAEGGAGIAEPGDAGGELELRFGERIVLGNELLARYTLPTAASVILAFYDSSGRRVRRLDLGHRPGGSHLATWNCRDDAGRPVPSGVYLGHLQAGKLRQKARVVLVR